MLFDASWIWGQQEHKKRLFGVFFKQVNAPISVTSVKFCALETLEKEDSGTLGVPCLMG